ncbi:MAG TPA: hypothetical protein VKM36_12185 [Balneolaceae bacterium]|nr:hypothetical protein [Balneolaceae bacterium]
MKNVIYTSLIIMLTAVMITDSVYAQNRYGKKKNQQTYSRHFNVNTVETIDGVVKDIIYKSSERNPEMTGVHLEISTGNEEIPVHLGPAWYVSQQQHTFSKGDSVTVTGSRITFNNAPAIIAAQVQKNDMVLQLRDENGMPNWRGWRRGNPRSN